MSYPEKITMKEARKLLKKAVATQPPDFSYRPQGSGWRCRYLPDPENSNPNARKTGCLGGTAFKIHGISDKMMKPWDDDAMGIEEIQKMHPELMTKKAAKYLGQAQCRQDVGDEWPKAAEAAELWRTDGVESDML